MSSFEEACPFAVGERAGRCASCHSANNGVPPCVAAYLRGSVALQPANVISLLRTVAVETRKAA